MTATANLSPPPQRRQHRSPGMIVGGTVLALLAVVAIGLGALSLWGDSRTDSAGYLSTKSDPFQTRTHALATDDLDINHTGWLVDHGLFGKVRVTVDSAKPVFVGIARSTDVDAYLRGSSYDEVTDVEYSPFRATYRAHPGPGKPAAPADQGIWAASTHGTGTQRLDWKVEDGKWSVVVMNADGSPGVTAGISAGAKVAWMAAIGWSSLGAGLLLLAGSAGLFVVSARPRRRPPAPVAEPAAA
jgi:hypothetical protein